MSKLEQQLIDEAAKVGIEVEANGFEVILNAPGGMCFEPMLHALVSAPSMARDGRHEPYVAVLRRALKDLRTYGCQLKSCSADCDCIVA